MFLMYLMCYLLSISYGQRTDGSPCTTSAQEAGICKFINECPAALMEFQRTRTHTLVRCGFEGLTEIVCCPQQATPANDVRQEGTLPIPSAPNPITEKQLSGAEKECKRIIETLPPPTSTHIVGGDQAAVGEFPHMAALAYVGKEGKYSFICGGSLIDPRHVLTAAHCVTPLDPSKVITTVRLGTVDVSNTTYNNHTDYNVSAIIVHPKYQRRYHDLAIIRLSRNVEYTEDVHSVCLYNGDDIPAGDLTITGWGVTSFDDVELPSLLLKTRVRHVERESCARHYGPMRGLEHGLSADMFCAGDDAMRRDTCRGDSGGPLTAMGARDGHARLVGVTSFGRSCAGAAPGVYTRAAAYRAWLQDVVWPALDLRAAARA